MWKVVVSTVLEVGKVDGPSLRLLFIALGDVVVIMAGKSESEKDYLAANEGGVADDGGEWKRGKVGRWITDEEFGVISSYCLPDGFSMIKEESWADGNKSYKETCFKRYKDEVHTKQGCERYVLSGELFLTVRMSLKKYFEDDDCSWVIGMVRSDVRFASFFGRDKFGMYNEYYGNYEYIKNLDEKKLELAKAATPIPETKFQMIPYNSKKSKNM